MRKFLIPAAAAALALVGTAAMAQPYGGYYGGYDQGRSYDDSYSYSYNYGYARDGYRAYRDSDGDGIPDRVEWNRDRDRDGRPDQWDRYDNRQDWRHGGRHHRHWRDWERSAYRYDYDRW
jgi:hypothetical protein